MSARDVTWVAVVLVTVMMLSPLSGAVDRASGALPGTSLKATSSLRIGALQEPDSMNPFKALLSASYVVFAHVYELLVGIGPDLSAVPALARSWSVSPDNLTWTFNLVHNATWHDGVAFTAEDVNFTFRMIADRSPRNPAGCSLLLLQSYLGGVDVGNITVVDPYTIRIPTVAPKANILSMFLQILPKHIWSTYTCDEASTTQNRPPVGTGMYRWTAWYRGAYTQLDLYPQYWRLGPSQHYVDQIIIIYYQDSTALYNAFVHGDIDATDALSSIQYKQVPDKVQGSLTTNVGRYTTPQISFAEMGMCVASDYLISHAAIVPPATGGRSWLVTNLTVRQALQLAVNRSSLVTNIIAGLGQPGSTIIPPATPEWHYNVPAADAYPFDPARARALLDDPKGNGFTLKAGQTTPGLYGENLDPTAANNQDAFIDTNGDHIRDVVNASQVVAGDRWGPSAPNRADLTLTLQVINTNIEGSDAADRMIQWWSDIGIAVTKLIVDSGTQTTATYACSEDLYLWGYGGDVDPDFLLSIMLTDQIGYWSDAWYSNATYDQLYLDQQTQVNATQRQATVREMQRIVYHDAPYMVMWYPYAITVVRTDKFSGWGDWVAHAGLGLTGFGNDLIMLPLRAGATPANNCPLKPVIEGPSGGFNAFVNETKIFAGTSGDADADPLTWIWSWDDGNATQLTTLSNVDSTNTPFAWASPGMYNVTVTVDDHKCTPVTSDLFPVKVLSRPAQLGLVAGTVRDASTNAPLAGVTISVSPGNYGATTNATGVYNVTLPPGTYTLIASRNLYASQTRSGGIVAANQTTTANFDLTPFRGWIAGTVTSSAGGSIAGVAILVVGARTYTLPTSGSGTYNITVGPGAYSISASHAGYVNQTKTGIVVSDGRASTVDFALAPVSQSAPGLDPLILAGAALAVIVVVVALVAWAVLRKRRKEEEIQGPPMPPQPPP